MRTRQRLNGIRQFIEQRVCAGREMKTPAPDYDVTKLTMQEPQCFVGYWPMELDKNGCMQEIINLSPCVLIMPAQSYAKYVEEQRFDRYSKIYRGQDMGQGLNVQILLSVYEPGIRLPGFTDGAEAGRISPELMLDGSEEGLFTLTDWMDDLIKALLGEKVIPGTDLFLKEANLNYGLRTDSEGVVDKRPLYYGIINAEFVGYAEESINKAIEDVLG